MIRIVIADDHTIMREGLKRILDGADDIEVVGEAVDGFEALAHVRKGGFDLLMLDLSMPGRDVKFLLKSRLAKGAPGPVERFKEHGVDFVVAQTLDELVTGMNEIARGPKLDSADLERQIAARDREIANPFTKDVQVMVMHNARRSRMDRVVRVAKPHRILDPAHGPLVAVRLNILSRKTLGGLQTNLDSQVIGANGAPVPGLYAAGEVAGFGGGGVHGHNALEGTFLGGCIFSGRAAGLALA